MRRDTRSAYRARTAATERRGSVMSNKLGRHELIRGLRNYLNALEKSEEGD